MTTRELYDSLYFSDSKIEQRAFVHLVEIHHGLISNLNKNNLEEYECIMLITCDYAITLEMLGYLKKSLTYLDKAIDLMENFPNYKLENLFKIQRYELLLFHKARALYNLNKYKESLTIFKQLDSNFPQCEKYQSWIIGLKVRKYEMLSWIGAGVVAVVLILKMLLSNESQVFNKFSLGILIVALVFSILCEILKRIELRKNNATQHTV